MGKGDKKTNPIYEGDLAKLCVDNLHKANTTIEAGGKTIYTRAQLNAIIQREVDPNRKVRTLPLTLLKVVLPFIRMVDKNTFDKFSFFAEVMQHDTIASQVGEMQFEDYIKRKVKEEVDSR
jgi:uncharacterized protein YbjT (DUF2867 family)